MTEYEYDYKQIFEEIEKYIISAKENALDEMANMNASEWERCESFGRYSALACICGSVDILKRSYRREVKDESEITF